MRKKIAMLIKARTDRLLIRMEFDFARSLCSELITYILIAVFLSMKELHSSSSNSGHIPELIGEPSRDIFVFTTYISYIPWFPPVSSFLIDT